MLLKIDIAFDLAISDVQPCRHTSHVATENFNFNDKDTIFFSQIFTKVAIAKSLLSHNCVKCGEKLNIVGHHFFDHINFLFCYVKIKFSLLKVLPANLVFIYIGHAKCFFFATWAEKTNKPKNKQISFHRGRSMYHRFL